MIHESDTAEEDNTIHMGNAIMTFYAALIDLLGRCAPEMHVSCTLAPLCEDTVAVGVSPSTQTNDLRLLEDNTAGTGCGTVSRCQRGLGAGKWPLSPRQPFPPGLTTHIRQRKPF